MARTGDMTSGHDDLFRAVTGHNLGISRAFFEAVGGFDESFARYGGEDTEFGYRVQMHGGLLAPERGAFAWHQGRWAEGRSDKARDQALQRAKLAGLIADPGFRPAGPGRAFAVPRHVVTVEAGDAPAACLAGTVEALLGDPAGDLVVRIAAPEGRSEDAFASLAARFGGEPRVRVASASPAARPASGPAWGASLDAFPVSPFHIALPAGAAFRPGLADALRRALGDAVVGGGRAPGRRARLDRPGPGAAPRPAHGAGDIRARRGADAPRGGPPAASRPRPDRRPRLRAHRPHRGAGPAPAGRRDRSSGGARRRGPGVGRGAACQGRAHRMALSRLAGGRAALAARPGAGRPHRPQGARTGARTGDLAGPCRPAPGGGDRGAGSALAGRVPGVRAGRARSGRQVRRCRTGRHAGASDGHRYAGGRALRGSGAVGSGLRPGGAQPGRLGARSRAPGRRARAARPAAAGRAGAPGGGGGRSGRAPALPPCRGRFGLPCRGRRAGRHPGADGCLRRAGAPGGPRPGAGGAAGGRAPRAHARSGSPRRCGGARGDQHRHAPCGAARPLARRPRQAALRGRLRRPARTSPRVGAARDPAPRAAGGGGGQCRAAALSASRAGPGPARPGLRGGLGGPRHGGVCASGDGAAHWRGAAFGRGARGGHGRGRWAAAGQDGRRRRLRRRASLGPGAGARIFRGGAGRQVPRDRLPGALGPDRPAAPRAERVLVALDHRRRHAGRARRARARRRLAAGAPPCRRGAGRRRGPRRRRRLPHPRRRLRPGPARRGPHLGGRRCGRSSARAEAVEPGWHPGLAGIGDVPGPLACASVSASALAPAACAEPADAGPGR